MNSKMYSAFSRPTELASVVSSRNGRSEWLEHLTKGLTEPWSRTARWNRFNCLLGCDAVADKHQDSFCLQRRWRQQAPLKHLCSSTQLHNNTLHRTAGLKKTNPSYQRQYMERTSKEFFQHCFQLLTSGLWNNVINPNFLSCSL